MALYLIMNNSTLQACTPFLSGGALKLVIICFQTSFTDLYVSVYNHFGLCFSLLFGKAIFFSGFNLLWSESPMIVKLIGPSIRSRRVKMLWCDSSISSKFFYLTCSYATFNTSCSYGEKGWYYIWSTCLLHRKVHKRILLHKSITKTLNHTLKKIKGDFLFELPSLSLRLCSIVNAIFKALFTW